MKSTAFVLLFMMTLLCTGIGNALAAIGDPLIPSGFRFNTTLQEGSVKVPDVKYLQRFLNNDPRTVLSNISNNPCIVDTPTDFYGLKTKDAVMRFQNLYRSEVLTPAGLVSPTGILGPLTRNKINQLLTTPAYSTIISTTTFGTNSQTDMSVAEYLALVDRLVASATAGAVAANNNLASSKKPKPVIIGASANIVSNCQQAITIYGTNFSTTTNTISSELGVIASNSFLVSSSTANSAEIRAINFSINQFNNYAYYQRIYAGTSRNIHLTLTANGQTTATSTTVRFIFPGNTTPQTPAGEEILVEEPEIPELGAPEAGSNNQNPNGSSGDGSSLGTAAAVVGGAIVAAYLAQTVAAAAAGTAVGAAQTAVIGNFGGTLTTNFYCSCSNNNLLTIRDVRGPVIQLMYQPGASILYMYYSLTPGVNVLGDYIRGGVCMVPSTTGCQPFGAPIGTVKQIGTSLPVPAK